MDTHIAVETAVIPSVVAGEGKATKEAPSKVTPNPLEKVLQTKYAKLKSLYNAVVSCDRNKEKLDTTYKDRLKAFAEECLDIWKLERAQGSRKGKGFEAELKKRDIPKGRAYRAMKMYCPEYLKLNPPRCAEKGCKLARAANSKWCAAHDKEHRSERTMLEFVQPVSQKDKELFQAAVSRLGAEKATEIILTAVIKAAAKLPKPAAGKVQAAPAPTVTPASAASKEPTTMVEEMREPVEAGKEDKVPVRFAKVSGLSDNTWAIYNAKGDKLDLFVGDSAEAECKVKFTEMVDTAKLANTKQQIISNSAATLDPTPAAQQPKLEEAAQ